MKAKKVLAALLSISMLTSLCACGEKAADETTKKSKKEKDSEESVEATVEDGEESESDTVVTESEMEVEITEEAALTEFLEQTMIPTYGIYDPSQARYYEDGMAGATVNIIEYTYNPETKTLDSERRSERKDEWHDYETMRQYINEHARLYSGIYYATIDDVDSDGSLDLLVIIALTGDYPYPMLVQQYNYDGNEVGLSKSTELISACDEMEFGLEILSLKHSNKMDVTSAYLVSTSDGLYLKCVYSAGEDIEFYDSIAMFSLRDFAYTSFMFDLEYADWPTEYYWVCYPDTTIYDAQLDYDHSEEEEAEIYEKAGIPREKGIQLFGIDYSTVNDFQIKYLFEKG
ncbi:MAG: hypothetical protein J6Y08_02370 [Clostridiales bacterium]|nr:hypothetical protein [Clostridiales bacterium]